MARSFLVVLGRGQAAAKFQESYRVDGEHQPRLCFVDPLLVDSGMPASDRDLNAPGMTLAALTRMAEQSQGVVVIEETARLRPELLEWLTRLHYEDLPVYTLETFHEKHWRRVAVDTIEATWPWQTDSHLASVSAYSHAKRLLDIVVAGAALLVLSPLFVILALLVRLDDGAPVLFSQQRVGRDRRAFWLYKFRTMRVRATGEEGSLYTGTNDPRITRVGAWLRKLRLDELPQLWNVLRGDMSLIGPRAEWDRLVDNYEKAIQFYHFRHPRQAGDHRLGTGQLSLRREPDGHGGKAQVRPVLHPPLFPAPGCHDRAQNAAHHDLGQGPMRGRADPGKAYASQGSTRQASFGLTTPGSFSPVRKLVLSRCRSILKARIDSSTASHSTNGTSADTLTR